MVFYSSPQLVLCRLQDDGFGVTYSVDQPLSDINENDHIYCLEVVNQNEEDQIAMQSQTGRHEFASPTAVLFVVHVEKVGTSANR